MFRMEAWVRDLLDGCFRIRYVLEYARLGQPWRRKPDEVHWSQKEPSRAKQLNQGRLKVAFTPGAAKRKLFVKRLPAYPNFGHRCIRIVIQPLLVPHSSGKLQ